MGIFDFTVQNKSPKNILYVKRDTLIVLKLDFTLNFV